jgi:hypothetical protein
MKGTAPVPLRVRPDPRRPGKDYRSPIIADGLHWPLWSSPLKEAPPCVEAVEEPGEAILVQAGLDWAT